MRRLLIVPVVAVAITIAGVSASHAATPPDIEAHRGDYSADIPNGGTFAMGTTSVGVPFTQYFAVGNVAEGGDDLHITSTTGPVGITILQAPPATIHAGAAWGVQLKCNATAVGTVSGPLTIVSDDPDEPTFTVTVSCTTQASAGTPAVRVGDRNGVTIPNAGAFQLLPGKTTLIRVYNEGSSGPLVLGTPSVVGGPPVAGWVPDDVVAVNGMSMYFNISCTDGKNGPALTGDFPVTIPHNGPGGASTFTLHCSTEAVVSNLPSTGRSLWLAALAASLTALGAGVVKLSGRRRRALG